MAEWLTNTLAARRRNPEDNRVLLRTLAQQQGAGDLLNTITRSSTGDQLMSGPDPYKTAMALRSQGERGALEDARLQRQAERDAVADEQWRQEFEQRGARDAAREARYGGGVGAGGKPTAKIMGQILANREALGRLDEISGDINALGAEGRENLDSPWYEIVGGAMLPSTFKRRADEAFYDEASEDILQQGEAFNSNIRRAFAGTAVTKYEGEDTDKWSPMAPGLSLDQRQRRMDTIREDLLRSRDVYTGQYGDFVPGYEPPAPTAGGPINVGGYTVEVLD